tara:strand:+ start:575 stop:1345 length:771 start_codon:yes stop_codon:yes gene_type:complete
VIEGVNMSSVHAVWARHRDVWLKRWGTYLIPPIIEPLLYLGAFGFGLGTFIGEIEGMSYARFIAPALIAVTIMNTSFTEATYGAFVRMYYQRTWESLASTPCSKLDVMVGELAWAATKAMVNAMIMSIIIVAFGLMTPWSLIWMPLLAIPIGLAFAGLGMIVTAYTPSIDFIILPFSLFIYPMFLFAGTFFPVSALPEAGQWIAMCVPLTHATVLTRAAGLGMWTADVWISAAYIAAMVVITVVLGTRLAQRRIMR